MRCACLPVIAGVLPLATFWRASGRRQRNFDGALLRADTAQNLLSPFADFLRCELYLIEGVSLTSLWVRIVVFRCQAPWRVSFKALTARHDTEHVSYRCLNRCCWCIFIAVHLMWPATALKPLIRTRSCEWNGGARRIELICHLHRCPYSTNIWRRLTPGPIY